MKYYYPAILITLLIFSTSLRAQQLTEKALNSKCYSTEGDSIALKEVLSQLKNEAALIDLWATWCKDCIVGFPKVKDLQTEYQDITFLFLSVDKSTEEWIKGIDRFGLTGTHFRLENGWKSDLCGEIELDWIPRYLIIDKTGKILHHKSILADDEELINSLNGVVAKK